MRQQRNRDLINARRRARVLWNATRPAMVFGCLPRDIQDYLAAQQMPCEQLTLGSVEAQPSLFPPPSDQ